MKGKSIKFTVKNNIFINDYQPIFIIFKDNYQDRPIITIINSPPKRNLNFITTILPIRSSIFLCRWPFINFIETFIYFIILAFIMFKSILYLILATINCSLRLKIKHFPLKFYFKFNFTEKLKFYCLLELIYPPISFMKPIFSN